MCYLAMQGIVTDSREVAEHAAGSSVKAMAAVQISPGEHCYSPIQWLAGTSVLNSHTRSGVVDGFRQLLPWWQHSHLAMSRAGSWYVITAGSKEVLMAWRFSFQASSSSAGVSLQHQWLATRPPPRTGLRPQSRKQAASVAATEHRYLALAVLPVLAGCLHVVAASSSATLQLLRVDLMTKK